ncbi:hypothetical protein CMUS01_15283 [Colletotrichum musicola]|uniref:Uncharacterized protein n=1 Tax=Colletotrichum musicola TaxID=2175873 RepID=A0A8H6IXI3_9PEZI|nr:hypothetical protein CMUS01_15283 [Colletotrichum musicola]
MELRRSGKSRTGTMINCGAHSELMELKDNQCQRALVPAEDPLQALCLGHRLCGTSYANDDNEGLDN